MVLDGSSPEQLIRYVNFPLCVSMTKGNDLTSGRTSPASPLSTSQRLQLEVMTGACMVYNEIKWFVQNLIQSYQGAFRVGNQRRLPIHQRAAQWAPPSMNCEHKF